MYAVIFKAELKQTDSTYSETASRLRERAMREYGCLDFVSVVEGQEELSISYWPDLEKIKAWKDDNEHRKAQALGQARWYHSYQVQVVKLLREYGTQS